MSGVCSLVARFVDVILNLVGGGLAGSDTEVVLRALEREPELRYQQASQVKCAVETIAAGTPPPLKN